MEHRHKRSDINRPTRKQVREERRQKARRRKVWLLVSIFGFLFILPTLLVLIGFFTPWGRNFRLTLAETIITTRHYYWAHYITTPEEYAQLVKALHQTPIGTGLPDIHLPWAQPSDNVIEIKPLDGLPDYNGYVMLVHDPHLVRLVAAEVHGGEGEYITHMAKRVGAIAGTNASGFEDPNGSGWGGIPVGLEYIGGRVVSNVKGAYDWTTVGFTKDGVMVMGPYNVQQLRELGVRDAMQFHPELIVNGKPMITYGDGGWGYDPRTAIGQTKDGTVIFVVINGRFRGGSGRGASQRQVMEIMQKYGAINACAMDGGSSSVLYANGKIVNSPSTIDPNGQRHLPDAWMVFPNRQAADAYSP